jgi:ATP-dependent DNA helicase DinG
MDPSERLSRFFGPGGKLERAHPAHERRLPQEALAADVLETLRQGGHLVAEAGTGTGKTLAYLVPALMLGRRIIISTGTKTLQDQLAQQDLPFLRENCGFAFDWVVLKGRDNYLCRQRFEIFRQSPSFPSRDEGAFWPDVLRWSGETETGDVAELTGLPENPGFWSDINAKDSTCTGQRCGNYDDCYLHELRRESRTADIVVVNHHLFLADAALREGNFGAILPDADAVIFDEAHRLESAATSFFGRSVSNWRLRELGDDVVRELARTHLDTPAVLRAAKRVAECGVTLTRAWAKEPGRRVLPATLPPMREEALRAVRASVIELRRALSAVVGPESQAVEGFLRRCEQLDSDLEFLELREDPTWVYWSEPRGRGIFLTATPVDVSSMLHERVFAPLRASVLTSATLAIGGRMDHVRARLGLVDPPAPPDEEAPAPALTVREAVHASPFDYESQGLLYLPRDLPQPRDQGFSSACAERMRELTLASEGRAFLLFTSHENLRRVHEILRLNLPFPSLVQGEAPKAELLRRFREDPSSVLFATASFWEGVDVRGEALSLVAIDKLPFGVPTDPINAARSRLVESAGGSPFMDLALPEAVLSLKQGVGRLIRSTTDRGVVALLDVRASKTRWGRAFPENLPAFRRSSDLDDVHRFFEA